MEQSLRKRRSALARAHHERFKAQVRIQLTKSVFKPWCVVIPSVFALLLFLVYEAICIGVVHVYLLPEFELCDNTTMDSDFLFQTDMFVLYPLITMIYAALFFTSVYCISYNWVRLYIVTVLGLIFVVNMYFSSYYFMLETYSNDNGTLAPQINLSMSNTIVIIAFCLCQFPLTYLPICRCKNWDTLLLCSHIIPYTYVVFVGYIYIQSFFILIGSSASTDTFLLTWESLKYCKTASDNYIIFFHSQIIINHTVHFVLLYMLSKYVTMHWKVGPHQQGVHDEDKDHDIVIDQPDVQTSMPTPLGSHPEDMLVHHAHYNSLDATRQTEERTSEMELIQKYMVRKPPIPLNFIHHEQLECDHNGCNYTIEGHDITVRIPEGAVAEGEKIHFEVGVAMYGPFIFPDNTQPISPILWLRQLEGGTQLKRCYQLVLPHCYKGLASIIYHGPGHNKIFFATSDHSSSRHISTDGNVELLYSLIEWENDIDFDIDDNYGTFESYICNHIFCIVKRSHTQSYEWYRDVGFSLVRVDLQPSQTVQEFHFYGLFDLATHKKALENKLEKKGQTISSSTSFKFEIEGKTQPCLKLASLTTDKTACFHPPTGEIRAVDINFWNISFKEFKAQENDSYPPQVAIKVSRMRQVDIFSVKVFGCTNNLEYELVVLSGQDYVVEEVSMSSSVHGPTIASPHTDVAAIKFTVGKERDQDFLYNDAEDQGLESFTPQVKQSTFFSAAEKTAGVPFLYHHLLECDSAGREWTNVYHDITVRIPEGAVVEGEKIHFEVGVAMYGPFIFPDNTQPISPILWLCLLNEDVELKKPFQVVLPHYLTGLSKERVQYHQVGFAKASHNDYTFVDGQMTFKFQSSEMEPVLSSHGCRSYGVLIAKHCCFYCLKANHTKELAKDAGYCLTRIESSLSPQRNEVYFSVTYFLETCLRSLEEQFPREVYQVSRTDGFKFQDSTEPLKLTVPTEQERCVIAMEPTSAKIKPSDVDFWSRSFADMQLRHKRSMYPPRVKMTVTLRNRGDIFKVPVKFSGHVDAELDVELTVPLGLASLSPTSSMSWTTGSGSHYAEPSSHTIGRPPELRDAFMTLLPLAFQWKTIGIILRIPKHVLDKVQSDEEGINNCLQEMLSQWLKQVDPAPTWKDLANAVDVVDQKKAKEIREQYDCVDVRPY